MMNIDIIADDSFPIISQDINSILVYTDLFGCCCKKNVYMYTYCHLQVAQCLTDIIIPREELCRAPGGGVDSNRFDYMI